MSNPATARPQESPPIAISRRELPVCCPRPDAPLWNMHPRVYLPIADDPPHEAVCPYCGARYRLID
ncbi:zinc-finger domain-containing protein [Thermochromatium tepidum]|uniref:Zinc-finger domain-containing protein n=1 Tax=Thermochromatium tepidum ATCC 43061 TaxID=316276 RepID=A0A6I6DVQ9_THETI|nr:zinc-finger domain-containing protein [Thermochromatium tepidum]QGU31644.1 zinc-finger domain-containing protein [Thermochromatium tepidum ATCC 43061]